jgi:hypothetical protein
VEVSVGGRGEQGRCTLTTLLASRFFLRHLGLQVPEKVPRVTLRPVKKRGRASEDLLDPTLLGLVETHLMFEAFNTHALFFDLHLQVAGTFLARHIIIEVVLT